jgi:hypothetical protein
MCDGNCIVISAGISPSKGQAQVNVTGASVGQLYVVSVKYLTSSVSRTPIGSTTPIVHYDFVTKVNGAEVVRDPDGLNLSSCGASPLPGFDVDPSLELLANYPNPFNATTSIRFALAQDAHVRLDIYNILGQKVRTLLDEDQPAGEHSVLWNGTDESGNVVASGIYFTKIISGNQARVQRMMLLK